MERTIAAEGMLKMSSMIEQRELRDGAAAVSKSPPSHGITRHAQVARAEAAPARAPLTPARSTAEHPAPPHAAAPATSGAGWQVSVAHLGDHHAACQFLATQQRAPSAAEFQAQLDDPYYEPTDRLLCKVQRTIIGHARLVKREMHFGPTTLPISNLTDFLVLPEYSRQGCGSALLAAAEKEMVADGALLGIVRTQQPQFFLRRGWCVWTRHCYSTAGAREILSQLLQSPKTASADEEQNTPPLNIRLWRHIETTGLMRLYAGNRRQVYGPLVRSDAYWQWLLSRHGFDRIYVAIHGPDRFDLNEGAGAMVGYAVMKEGRILELMTSPDHPQAAPLLLARACADTIEQNGNYVRLEAPVGDPLHHVIARAGGELGYHEAVQGEVCLVKLFDLSQAIERLGEQLVERAKAAGLSLPLYLGLVVDGEKFELEVRPRSVKFKPGRLARSHLDGGLAEVTQLLLGHLDVKVAVAAGRITVSTHAAMESAAALFPKLSLWRSPWDEVPAH